MKVILMVRDGARTLKRSLFVKMKQYLTQRLYFLEVTACSPFALLRFLFGVVPRFACEHQLGTIREHQLGTIREHQLGTIREHQLGTIREHQLGTIRSSPVPSQFTAL